jgi:hypothetical protein
MAGVAEEPDGAMHGVAHLPGSFSLALCLLTAIHMPSGLTSLLVMPDRNWVAGRQWSASSGTLRAGDELRKSCHANQLSAAMPAQQRDLGGAGSRRGKEELVKRADELVLSFTRRVCRSKCAK